MPASTWASRLRAGAVILASAMMLAPALAQRSMPGPVHSKSRSAAVLLWTFRINYSLHGMAAGTRRT
jgi:hypothetical protein